MTVFVARNSESFCGGVIQALAVSHATNWKRECRAQRMTPRGTSYHLFPWTVCVPMGQPLSALSGQLRSSGFPAAQVRKLQQSGFLDGVMQEIDWALRIGGSAKRATELHAYAETIRGFSKDEAEQAITDFILGKEGFPSVPIVDVSHPPGGMSPSIRFRLGAPYDSWRSLIRGRNLSLPSGVTDGDLQRVIVEHWSARPSLIWAHLVGSLWRTVSGAEVLF